MKGEIDGYGTQLCQFPLELRMMEGSKYSQYRMGLYATTLTRSYS